jgi:DNA-binding CsgD family transcriptional regulator
LVTGVSDRVPGPLRGGVAVVAVLGDRLQAAAHGRGGVVLVDGAPGIGKTRLIANAVATASRIGVSVATARADDAEQLSPLAPLARALGGQLSPSARGGDTSPRLLDNLRSELASRVTRSSLLVALDELQWADPATLLAVRSLASQLASSPLLWLLAGRGETNPSLERTFAALELAVGGERLHVGPLSPQAVGEVVGDAVGARPDSGLLGVTAGAGGNPLLLVELLEGLRDEGAIDVVEGKARLVSRRMPRRLQAVVARRLRGLSSEALRLLEVGAVLGRSFSLDTAAAVIGRPVGALLRPLEEALHAGVLIPSRDRLMFRHYLVLRTVYEGISEAARGSLHRQIGELLLAEDGPAFSAAGHLILGARPGDRQAVTALERAAIELLAASPQAAADLASRALELSDPAEDEHFFRASIAVDALVAAGQLRDAADVARAAVAHPGAPVEAAARLRLMLSSMLLMAGQPAEAIAHAEAVEAVRGLADPLYDDAELTRLLAVLAQGDFERARELAEAILAGGERPGGDLVLAGALTTFSTIAWDEGRVADALSFMRAAVRRSEGGRLEPRRLYPRLGLATMLIALGGFDEAAAVITGADDEPGLGTDTVWAAVLPVFWALLHLATGQLAEAVAEARLGLAMTSEWGASWFRSTAKWVLASAALYSDDIADGLEHLEPDQSGPLAITGWLGSEAVVFTEARLAEVVDGPTNSMQMASIFERLPAHKGLLVVEPAAAACLVRNALAVGDHHRAASIVAAAELVAASNPGFASLAASASHARGLLDGNRSALEQAAGSHRHPWARASAMEDVGALIGEVDPGSSRVSLEAALATYEQVRAERDAARVRTRLQKVAARRRRKGHNARPASGWASLTDTELNVARLVAQGLTNPQVADGMFLSRHTVDFHLRHIFRKLDIRSRVELARLVIEREMRPLSVRAWEGNPNLLRRLRRPG